MVNDILEATGLPEAPEGMFWRVLNASWSSLDAVYKRYEVRLIQPMIVKSRLKRWFRKSEEITIEEEVVVESYFLGADITDVNPENILKGARYILLNLQIKESAQSLLGDYPPKKLETREA